MKRLCIFFFYDAQGVVDRYIPYMLNDIKKNVDEILIVINGALNDEGHTVFKSITPHILVRKNVGFDVWAYKEGLEYYGWDALACFDEVIMMNFTIMGPLYPFAEMFNKMDNKEVDFWGLTLFHACDENPYGVKNKLGCIPLHVQSHFIAVRNRMLTNPAFRQYWETRPPIYKYEEAIYLHELLFTQTFESQGFTWDVYIDTRGSERETYCPILFTPIELIRDKRCPIIKRRAFSHIYNDILNNTAGEVVIELLKYIKLNFDYDTQMIWENFVRVDNQADYHYVMALNYILPTKTLLKSDKNEHKKILLVLHCYFADLFEYCAQYVSSMPKYADILITTDTQDKKNILTDIYKNLAMPNVKILVIENRGRDVSALLVCAKPYIYDYDYVCFAHDKKGSKDEYGTVGKSFAYKCFENVLATEMYVENIISTFEDNPLLGMLSPPAPLHGNYYMTVFQAEWKNNYDNVKQLAQALGLAVPINKKKAPVAPLGSMFWFRPQALKKMLDYNWQYDDFPKEPVTFVDGTISHAIERTHALVVQDAGYYCARVLTDTFAGIEMSVLHYYLTELTKTTTRAFQAYTHNDLIIKINKRKNKLTDSQVYIDNGKGFNENDILYSVLYDNDYKCEIKVTEGIKHLRFDPIEESACIVTSMKITSNMGIIPYDNVNGVVYGNHHLFANNDPQFMIKVPPMVEWIVIEAKVYPCDKIALAGLNADFITRYENTLTELNKTITELNKTIENINQSFFWRITKPARVLINALNRLFGRI